MQMAHIAAASAGIPAHPAPRPASLPPQWSHPVLWATGQLDAAELNQASYAYFLKFLPFFRDPKPGLRAGTVIDFAADLPGKMGEARLFENLIQLNHAYFSLNPWLLPYTIFHEMTHLWLYHCGQDPGHTARFFAKMTEFKVTGLPDVPSAMSYDAVEPERPLIVGCPCCKNRWHCSADTAGVFYCGYCYDKYGLRITLS